jgi:hypothetical protein
MTTSGHYFGNVEFFADKWRAAIFKNIACSLVLTVAVTTGIIVDPTSWLAKLCAESVAPKALTLIAITAASAVLFAAIFRRRMWRDKL